MNNRTIFLLFSTLLMIFSCGKEDGMNPQFEVPGTYDFQRNGTTTVFFGGQTTRIQMGSELIAAMQDFSISEETLLEMYTNASSSGGDANPFSDASLNASSKSIRSKVAASADFFSANTVDAATIKEDFASWVTAQTNEVFPNQNELAEAGKAGQIADGTAVRYVSGSGLEYNQAVNKGLIGALMTDQILNHYLSKTVLDAGNNRALNDEGTTEDSENHTTMEHKWDEGYGYLYGTSAEPTNPNISIGEDDAFLNKYIGKVNNDPDFSGIADDIWNAFKMGRSAIVAGDYKVRDEQVEIIREKISTVIAARAVYYLQQGKNGIENGKMGGAFHVLSEGLGFIYSLQFTRQPHSNTPYFTKAEVDTFITTIMEDGANGFWDVNPSTLNAIANTIAAQFDFTVAQAEE